MAKESRQPQRTCLGCREVRDQNDLIRVVRSPDNEVLVDLKGRLPGRGAYLCLRRECIDEAVRKRQFNRAFKTECQPVTTDHVLAAIHDELLSYLANLLGMARKSANFIAGSNAVLDALAKRTPLSVVLLAEDISRQIGEKIKKRAADRDIKVLELFDKEELGRILGRAERSVVGLPDSKLADAFLRELQRYQDISGDN